MVPVGLQRALAVTLGLWAVGVEVHEGIAAVGAWATMAVVLIIAVRLKVTPNVRRWWPLLALVAWSAIAPWLAGRPPTPTGLARLADWLLLPAAAFAVVHVSGRSLPRISLLVCAVLLVSCGVAASQYFGLWPRSSAFSSLEWTRLPFIRMDETVPGRDDRFMAGGLLLHRIKFAHTGAIIGALLVTAVVRKPPYRRVFIVVTLLCIPAIIVFPHARAAAVALLAGAFAAVAFGIDNRRTVLLALPVGALIVAGLLWAMPSVRERFEQGLTNDGMHEREIITQSGLKAIDAHPWAGEGLGRFKPSLYAPPDAPIAVMELQGKAHNQFISVAVEAGLPATAFFIALLLMLLREAWRSRPVGVPLLVTLTVFVLLCLLHDPLFQPGPTLAIMLALGGSLGLIDRQQIEASSTAAARTS